MKQATAPAKRGFGAPTKAKAKKRAPVVPLDPSTALALDALREQEDQSLATYLSPAHLANREDIGRRLRDGEVVVLQDAFRPEFAEMVHAELSDKSVAWELNEAYFPDGYAHRHHNVYDRESWSARLNATLDVFSDAASQQLMSELTGRDCSGPTQGAPSWYKDGDHSLPHTDWVGQRTVSYVWHLSKNWRPEWGGALYWAQNDHAVATYPASFNTLVLFSVTTRSAHFVTTVSPHHKGRRLTFNGWWQSAWSPQPQDDLEVAMQVGTRRDALTHTQLQAVSDIVGDRFQNIDDERRETLRQLCAEVKEDFFPHGARAGLQA
tara:strand:- start:279 stop:1244 length:966 start_codon:yes stop_codon:yes gene_type:complete